MFIVNNCVIKSAIFNIFTDLNKLCLDLVNTEFEQHLCKGKKKWKKYTNKYNLANPGKSIPRVSHLKIKKGYLLTNIGDFL